jgi:outer membrane protein OmpA-like peptidoglycan-associated protein
MEALMTQLRFFRLLSVTVVGLMAGIALAAPAAAGHLFDTDGVYTSPQEIKQAQAILVQDGELAPGSFQPGVLDQPTVKALREFQCMHRLGKTGVLDYETMALLTSHFVPGDADGDSVTDALDRCPDTPQGATVDQQGCPKDSDGDGVFNGIDACPGTPHGASVDSRGCPSDADRDGVPDGIDQCPDTPRGASVDAKGCPSDSDNDGVYDGLDYCPGTPAGKPVDARGCPEPGKSAAIFEGGKKKLVLEGVNFETNSAKLTSDSSEALDRVARSLKDWPDVKVEIGGYTDSVGSEAHNLSLSKARAQSVLDYLVKRGIDSSRLVAKGYGETDPIADNGSAAGRAKNRRVELTRID